MTIPGVDATVALSIVAAVGDFSRFRARRSWSATSGSTRGCASRAARPPTTDGSPSRAARTHAGMLVEAAWAAAKAARPAARVLRTRPCPPRHADRGRRDRAEARRALLAPDQQERGLRLRAALADSQEAARARAPRRPCPHAAARKAPRPPTRSKKSADARTRSPQQGEHAYRQLVAELAGEQACENQSGRGCRHRGATLRPSSGNPARRGFHPHAPLFGPGSPAPTPKPNPR